MMSHAAPVSSGRNNQTVLDQVVARVAVGLLHWANRRNEPRSPAPARECVVRGVRPDYYSASWVVISQEPRGRYFP
jgi:hypothetical protein